MTQSREATAGQDELEALEYQVRGEQTVLYHELCQLANLNPNFRRGALDMVKLEVAEGVLNVADLPEEQGGYYEVEEDDDKFDDVKETEMLRAMLESRMEFGYRFEARRTRNLVEAGGKTAKERQDAVLHFSFEVYGRHDGVLLPPDIALGLLGGKEVSAGEAQQHFGLVTQVQAHNYGLNGESLDLTLCESNTYLTSDYVDDSERTLVEACTCPGVCEVAYVVGHGDEECEDEEDDAEGNGEVIDAQELEIRQLKVQYALERDANQAEVPVVTDADQAAAEWKLAEDIRDAIETYDRERRVREARVVVRRIHSALLRQVGIEV